MTEPTATAPAVARLPVKRRELLVTLKRLGKAVHNVFALSTSTLTAPLLAVTALAGQALGSFRLEGTPDGNRQVAELTIGPSTPLVGQVVAELTSRHDALVLAHLPKAAGEGPSERLRVVHWTVLLPPTCTCDQVPGMPALKFSESSVVASGEPVACVNGSVVEPCALVTVSVKSI